MSTATTRAPAATATSDRRQPDPAAAVHGYPLAGRTLADVGDGPERRREPAAERRRGSERRAPSGERATRLTSAASRATNSAKEPQPVKPGWVWSRQTCWSPARAFGADAARGDERRGDAVADPPACHAGTDRDHGAGELVPGNVRQHDVRVVALPRVPVAAAHPRGRDGDHDAVCRRLRIGHVDEPRRVPERLDHHSAHRRRG